ncbi:MAG: hypothetical protein ACHP84_03675 [Caulobacterales bacterium]
MSTAQAPVGELSDGPSELRTDLDADLDPMALKGETLRFDLSAYQSTITREMLQARLRRTGQAFGAGDALIAANVSPDGGELLVDAAALMAANACVHERLRAGPDGALGYLRRLRAARAALDRAADAFGRRVSCGRRPSRASLIAYVNASAQDQALGALKFCLPNDIRTRLSSLFDDPALVEALLSPDAPSLWSDLKSQELKLAQVRLLTPGEDYLRRLRVFRRAFGYLYAEDVDFRSQESLSAIDLRVAALGAESLRGVAVAQQRLRAARRADRGQKAEARRIFADRLTSAEIGHDGARLVSHVLLIRALAAHEGQNRRGKMRLLRDLRDLGDAADISVERASLRDFAAACEPKTRPLSRTSFRHECGGR